MVEIKTRFNERKIVTNLVDDVLQIVNERAEAEGVSKATASRHATAVRGVVKALGVSRSKVVKPAPWIALYARQNATSTAISNMKFVAVILEWAEAQNHIDGEFYGQIARAIRTALAVRAA